MTPGAAPLNTMQHVVFVLDQNDTNGGVNLNGTATLYLNNGAPVKAAIQPFIDLMGGVESGDYNNWLGRSPWPDTLFDGSIDEFRIYDHALTSGEVGTSFTNGCGTGDTAEAGGEPRDGARCDLPMRRVAIFN